LPLAILSFSVFWGAIQFVLIPLQVQRIDPTGQNGSLAAIVAIGAIASMIGAPIAGALTDRTRSRLGGRAPWMIAGALASLALALAMAAAPTIPLMVVVMVLLQFTTALILTPVSAYIPDRVPAPKRGLFSAAYGAAQLVGGVIGQTVGAGFASALLVGYLVAGVVLAVLVILFALVNVRSNIDEPKPPLNLRAIASTFWVSPVAHPNFAWTFFGRFLLFTGYFPLQTFLLYLLQDYIGLRDAAVAAVPTIALASLVGTLVGSIAGGLIAQRIGRTKPIIFAASAIVVVGLVVPMIWPTLTAMIVYSALAGLGIGSYISVDLILITLVLPSAGDAGKDLGIINITTTLPQTIGAALGAIAIGLFGTYFALIPMAIAATVVGAVLLAFIRGVK
jgi:MFS family permease